MKRIFGRVEPNKAQENVEIGKKKNGKRKRRGGSTQKGEKRKRNVIGMKKVEDAKAAIIRKSKGAN